MTSTSRLLLALRDLAELAGRSGADLPDCTSWEDVETFVQDCLTQAASTSRTVPRRLGDLLHYQRLFESAEVRNQVSGTAGQVFQARDVHGDVHLHKTPAACSAYLEQVRRIAPDDLYDRDAELAELAAWCLDDEHDKTYTWWQAPAWTGKSALMSWFVLHPPAGVRVVSFFVTARLSSQNHKTAFAEVVLEQLAELLGQPLPELLTDATRDAHLLGLLAQAAAVTYREGERLVLVVDGLDEDRGVTVGPDAHSIAALLPARPAEGLRVVVAGRPHPPIPADVPDRHPLRDNRIVRRLDRSRHAEVVRADAQRELNHLLRGTPAERDLLGLVAAAGGGLSGHDLADLTGWPEWEVEEHLRAVSGRTFSHRADPPVFLLAHEQLQQDAIRMLGPAQVNAYRERLHAWADGFRDQGWPIGTPEYLQRGYFRLLHETGDVARMLACALDRPRHHRMLDLTGGNGAAITEIAAVQQVLNAQDPPDLLPMMRLVIYRAELHERSLFIPPELPQAWAHLGHHSRAEALAWSLPAAAQRVSALIDVARTVAAAGDVATARRIARTIDHPDAETRVFASAHKLPNPQSGTLTNVARTERVLQSYKASGRSSNHSSDDVTKALSENKLADAERLARAIPRGPRQWRALGQVVRALIDKGDLADAERVARFVLNPRQRARALTEMIIPIAVAGDRARAEALAAEAEKLAQLASPVRYQAEDLIALLKAVAVAGDLTRARQLADVVEDAREQGRALTGLVALMAARGESERAEEVTGTIAEPFWRANALVALYLATARAGDSAAAARILATLQVVVGAVLTSREQAAVWAGVPAGMALLGDPSGAESFARAIRHDGWRDQALTDLAVALATTGHVDRAESVAVTVNGESRRAQALIAAGVAAVRRGDVERGETIIEQIADPRWCARAFADLAAVARGAVARRFATTALTCCGAITFTEQKAIALSEVVTALARSGDLSEAEAVVRTIVISRWRDRALAGLASAVDLARARAIAGTINDAELSAQVLAGIAARSPWSEARRLIAAVLRLGKWTPVLDVLARIEPAAVLMIGDDVLSSPRP